MCQVKPGSEPKNLHEIICQATHAVPCRPAHAIGSLINLIRGREPGQKGCIGAGQNAHCECHPPQN
ncbi:MAG: hypothetical protein RJA63_3812 [Pseudomonadota bacterium]|jgi:hypothetical protein